MNIFSLDWLLFLREKIVCSNLSVFYFIVSRFYILSRKAFPTFAMLPFWNIMVSCILNSLTHVNSLIICTWIFGAPHWRDAPGGEPRTPRPDSPEGSFPSLLKCRPHRGLTICIGVCFWIYCFVSLKSLFSLQYKKVLNFVPAWVLLRKTRSFSLTGGQRPTKHRGRRPSAHVWGRFCGWRGKVWPGTEGRGPDVPGHEGAMFLGVPDQEDMLCVHTKLQVRQAGLTRARVGGKVRILSKW